MHVETGLLFVRLLAVVPGLVGNASIESRGGVAPVQADAASVPSFATVFDTSLGVRLLSERLQITLSYGPQILFRRPNLADRWRPLLMHHANLNGRWRATHSTTLNSQVSASAGEADYIALRQLIGMQQATLPNSIDLVTGRADAGIQVMTSPSNRWRTTAFGQHLQPLGGALDTAATSGIFVFPRQTQAGLGTDYVHAVDGKTTLGGSFEVGYLHHTSMITNTFALVTPKLLVTHKSERNEQFAAGLGVTCVQSIASTQTPIRDLFPAADLSFDTRVFQERHTVVSVGTTVRIAWVLDPILGSGAPVGTASLFSRATFSPRWIATPSLSFSTSLNGEPRTGEPNETLFSAQTPILYRVNSNVSLEFGGRFFQSAPHLSADRFRVSQREIWAYFAVRTNFDTGKTPTR
ncbi:MAG: hypothetical protein SGI86_18820 [Deltaproteobacteria bacterium]|nr:hypothetical protein [Deltaproteobacteria bacterium]